MSARDAIVRRLWVGVPSADDGEAQSVAEQMLDAYRDEVREPLAAELEQVRAELAEASRALRDAHTRAGLVAEYHVPLAGQPDRWLCVRRDSSDRWVIRTGQPVDGVLRAWTGDGWAHLRDAGQDPAHCLREYPSADAALDEAVRLAEQGVET